ncbi:MAG: hypothetical protein J6J35_03560, partial [Alphaproteobacteria bacterium]|nr:hypothetical protein [Alphaproteobacteria bacterium]
GTLVCYAKQEAKTCADYGYLSSCPSGQTGTAHSVKLGATTSTCYSDCQIVGCPDGYFKDDWGTTHPSPSDPIHALMEKVEHPTSKGCYKPECKKGYVEYTDGVKQLVKDKKISIPVSSTWGGMTCAAYQCTDGKTGNITNPDSTYFNVDKIESDGVVCSKISCAHPNRAHTLCGSKKKEGDLTCYYNPTYNVTVLNFMTSQDDHLSNLYVVGDMYGDGTASFFKGSDTEVIPTFNNANYNRYTDTGYKTFTSNGFSRIGVTTDTSARLVPDMVLSKLELKRGEYTITIDNPHSGCYEYSVEVWGGIKYSGRLYLKYLDNKTGTQTPWRVCTRRSPSYDSYCEKSDGTTWTGTQNVSADNLIQIP